MRSNSDELIGGDYSTPSRDFYDGAGGFGYFEPAPAGQTIIYNSPVSTASPSSKPEIPNVSIMPISSPGGVTNPNDDDSIDTIKDIINKSLAENATEMPSEEITMQSSAGGSGGSSSILVLVVLAAVGIGGYLYWRSKQ